MAGLTAWQALFIHGRLGAGQSVLIHGAGGGVGTVAIQLAHAAGAHVVATGHASSQQLVTELGAEVFVDVDQDHFEEAVEAVDLVGGDVLHRSWSVVKPGGAIVEEMLVREQPRESVTADDVDAFMQEYGDWPFCLIVLARRPSSRSVPLRRRYSLQAGRNMLPAGHSLTTALSSVSCVEPDC